MRRIVTKNRLQLCSLIGAIYVVLLSYHAGIGIFGHAVLALTAAWLAGFIAVFHKLVRAGYRVLRDRGESAHVA